MCGRFVQKSSPEEYAEQFQAAPRGIDGLDAPRYNLAPRQEVLAVRERRTPTGLERVLSPLRWGLIPSWASDPTIGDRLINARAETLATTAAYHKAFAAKRCVIPADGFYEWRIIEPATTPSGRARKQPMFIHRRDDRPLAFAGLWDIWKVPDALRGIGEDPDGWLRTCVIVTREANSVLAPVHNRMPVLLPASTWDRWLEPGNRDLDELGQLLVTTPGDELELWPVSTMVNAAANDTAELVTPARPQ